ncbi:MAG: DedA family protein [Actinomycetota bacterium]
MLPDAVMDALTGGWALALMSAMVLGDAFTVVIPGEVAVSALGALAISTGAPALWAVISCAAVAATVGDLACYAIGRALGDDRWRWTRTPRVRRAQDWARGRLEAGTATVLFTARFVPFARLAVNLAAGAMAIPLRRYAPLVLLAATGWALYQAAVGAAVASIVPGGPLVAIPVSVGVAIALGVGIDFLSRRIAARQAPPPPGPERE